MYAFTQACLIVAHYVDAHAKSMDNTSLAMGWLAVRSAGQTGYDAMKGLQ
jgi:hypothetical protein